MATEKYPPVVLAVISKMDETQRLTFESAYQQRKKGKVLMVLLAMFFPIQHFFLGKAVIGAVFWLTGFGLGVWWLIEIFLTSSRVNEYNAQVATEIARDIKLMT